MTLAPNHTFESAGGPDEAGGGGSPSAPATRYIISLCLVAVPVAIPQPRDSQLARFQFFFSHCWEDGRKQYRLHMGYFQAIAEARKWLVILSKIYPDAFVSEVPATQADSLTNTQVLRALETGCVDEVQQRTHRD